MKYLGSDPAIMHSLMLLIALAGLGTFYLLAKKFVPDLSLMKLKKKSRKNIGISRISSKVLLRKEILKPSLRNLSMTTQGKLTFV